MKKRKGLTLVEIMCVVISIGVVFAIAASLLGLGSRTKSRTDTEFDLQTSMRTSADIIVDKVRYSTAIFIMPESSFNRANVESGDYLTEGWDYFGILETEVDGKPASEVVSYTYDKATGTHQKKVLIPARADLHYTLEFKKSGEEDSKAVSFDLRGKLKGVEVSDSQWQLASETEALNALQVIDWSTNLSKGCALAYRADNRDIATIGRVAMILDTSGSMRYDMSGRDGVAENKKRLTFLKKAAKDAISAFSESDSIELSIIPFDATANMPASLKEIYGTDDYTFLKTNNLDKMAQLRDYIDSLYHNGTTNTGDAFRRGYYALKNASVPEGVFVKEYAIILVDGDSSQCSLAPFTTYDRLDPPDYFFGEGDLVGTPTSRFRYPSQCYSYDGTFLGCPQKDVVTTGVLAGDGRGVGGTIDEHTYNYTLQTALMLKNRGVKPYVVAMSADVSKSGIQNLQEGLGVKKENGDLFQPVEEEALYAAFRDIQTHIMTDLWFVNGPKQVPGN